MCVIPSDHRNIHLRWGSSLPSKQVEATNYWRCKAHEFFPEGFWNLSWLKIMISRRDCSLQHPGVDCPFTDIQIKMMGSNQFGRVTTSRQIQRPTDMFEPGGFMGSGATKWTESCGRSLAGASGQGKLSTFFVGMKRGVFFVYFEDDEHMLFLL